MCKDPGWRRCVSLDFRKLTQLLIIWFVALGGRTSDSGEVNKCFLYVAGDPGEGITGGQTYSYTDAAFDPARSRIELQDWTGDGIVDGIWFTFGIVGDIMPWSTYFETDNINSNMAPGSYTNAQRAPFEESGHPGLWIAGRGYGWNKCTGQYEVVECVFNYTSTGAVLSSFCADFLQYGDGHTEALRGMVYYDADGIRPPARIASASLTETDFGMRMESLVPGMTTTVQRSENLLSWTNVGSSMARSLSTNWSEVVTNGVSSRFYRLLIR